MYAKEVCDVNVSQMKDSFSYRGHLQAAALFDTPCFTKYSKQFPQDFLDKVCSAYSFLCKHQLKSELEVLYSRDDFKDITGTFNYFSFILQNDLKHTFLETTKLLQIILTTPMTNADSERCFSTFKRIKSLYVYKKLEASRVFYEAQREMTTSTCWP